MAGEEGEEPTYSLKTAEGVVHSSKRFTGEGLATYANGDTYDGEYVEGYRRGKGTYSFAKNGDKYVGSFEQNRKHGIGRMVYSSKTGDEGEDEEGGGPKRGGEYHGLYENGMRSQEGTFTYYNGDVYSGQWKDGKKHGKGSYTYASDKSVMTGEWEKGKMKSGRWILANGTYYAGRFRYNKPFGKGVWIFRNGNQLTGDYAQELEEADEGEGGGEGEAAEEIEKPDPKVTCSFKCRKSVAIRG